MWSFAIISLQENPRRLVFILSIKWPKGVHCPSHDTSHSPRIIIQLVTKNMFTRRVYLQVTSDCVERWRASDHECKVLISGAWSMGDAGSTRAVLVQETLAAQAQLEVDKPESVHVLYNYQRLMTGLGCAGTVSC
jgi:hypothetical protein